VSQDAVQEFQVNRSNYGADLGGAAVLSINIVSKSGTNDVHGSLFGYFRNDGMDARDPFAFSQALQPGGPVLVHRARPADQELLVAATIWRLVRWPTQERQNVFVRGV